MSRRELCHPSPIHCIEVERDKISSLASKERDEASNHLFLLSSFLEISTSKN